MDNRYNDSGVDRIRSTSPAVPRYWDFLKYHLLLFLLPWAIAIIPLLGQIRSLARATDYGYGIFWGDGWAYFSDDEALTVIGIILRLLGSFAVVGLIIAILSAGLRFLPTLARSGRLRLGQVVKTGLRYFFPTFFAMILVGLIVGIVNTLLSFIPFLGFVATLAAAYVNALASIYYDYWFSYNEAAGRPVYSGPIDRLRALYSRDGEFFFYAFLLALSYLVLASSFVKPYIQMKMTQKMGMVDYSRSW
ncbi:hypothetical protein B9G55_14885 [Saccharibacillus sp. O16]|nr:hypothetical protein B9G55_14885 [Saccharibacillus sp. O16]